MNLFMLHENSLIAGRMNCDKHVVKMPVECVQMLVSSLLRHGADPNEAPMTQRGTRHKGGYHNHPMTRWVGDSICNFVWCYSHAQSLCVEYEKRYGKQHFAKKQLDEISAWVSWADYLPHDELTQPPQCMPDEYKVEGDFVEAYRRYYLYEKGRFARWNKGTKAPSWWEPTLDEEEEE